MLATHCVPPPCRTSSPQGLTGWAVHQGSARLPTEIWGENTELVFVFIVIVIKRKMSMTGI